MLSTSLIEDAVDDGVVGFFIAVDEHVSERSHVLECRQMLLWDETIFLENLKQVPVSIRFAPAIKGHEVISSAFFRTETYSRS